MRDKIMVALYRRLQAEYPQLRIEYEGRIRKQGDAVQMFLRKWDSNLGPGPGFPLVCGNKIEVVTSAGSCKVCKARDCAAEVSKLLLSELPSLKRKDYFASQVLIQGGKCRLVWGAVTKKEAWKRSYGARR
jgi:hypothetical protein